MDMQEAISEKPGAIGRSNSTASTVPATKEELIAMGRKAGLQVETTWKFKHTRSLWHQGI